MASDLERMLDTARDIRLQAVQLHGVAEELVSRIEAAVDAELGGDLAPDVLLIKCDVVGCDTSTPMDPETWEDGAPRGWMKVGARTVVAVSIGGELHEIAMHGLTCPAHRIDEKETP
jgi:hypothetical protein